MIMQDPSALAPPVLPFGDFRAETDPEAVASVLHHHDRLHTGSLATSELPGIMAKLGASWSDLELKEIRQVRSKHACPSMYAAPPSHTQLCCMECCSTTSKKTDTTRKDSRSPVQQPL